LYPASPARYIIRLSIFKVEALLAALEIAMPKSKSLKRQKGPGINIVSGRAALKNS